MADDKKAMAYYLPRELIRWVHLRAETERRSRSALVEEALNAYRKRVEDTARAGH